MKDIRRKNNQMIDLSKFTSNKKIFSKTTTNFVTKLYTFSSSSSSSSSFFGGGGCDFWPLCKGNLNLKFFI